MQTLAAIVSAPKPKNYRSFSEMNLNGEWEVDQVQANRERCLICNEWIASRDMSLHLLACSGIEEDGLPEIVLNPQSRLSQCSSLDLSVSSGPVESQIESKAGEPEVNACCACCGLIFPSTFSEQDMSVHLKSCLKMALEDDL
jgi:hypothetical protein